MTCDMRKNTWTVPYYYNFLVANVPFFKNYDRYDKEEIMKKCCKQMLSDTPLITFVIIL